MPKETDWVCAVCNFIWKSFVKIACPNCGANQANISESLNGKCQ